MKAMVFHQMDTEEVSDRFVAPCFVNGLEAYDEEINLGVEENMISNEYARRNLFCEVHYQPEEDDVEPEVIFKRSFLRMTKAITDFEAETITIYPEFDPFLEDIEEEEEEEKSLDDCDYLLDFNLDDTPLLGTSSSAGGHLTQEEAAKEALAIRISQKFALLEEVELNGDIIKEEEEAIKRMKGREEMKKVDKEITMINHTQAEAMWILTNVLCQVGVTTLIAKFLILDIPINREAPIVVGRGFLYTIGSILNTPEKLFLTFDGICHQTFRAARFDVLRTVESDNDDEEEYQIKRNKFRASIYGPKPAPYLNCNDPANRSLALQAVINPFRKISVWKKEEGCNRYAKSMYNTKLAQLLPRHIYSLYVVNWDVLNRMGCDGEIDDMLRFRLRESGSNEELFTSVAWIRAFNINEPIYAELCHEFYSTYEFDEVCADDELQTNKIIKFRLGGRAHNLTLLEFARRLGLYQVVELHEEGFNGGLCSDEHFNAQSPILRVIHKMITYGLYQRTTRYDKIQKNDLWLLSMFDARHQNGYANVAWLIVRKSRVLIDDMLRSLSALICCRDLDTITLRDLIDSEGKLIPEDPQPGVPRIGVPRPPRASMQDLYDRMGRMEIR
nr:hypothetical protein [Tanacetum cinerariifolium]